MLAADVGVTRQYLLFDIITEHNRVADLRADNRLHDMAILGPLLVGANEGGDVYVIADITELLELPDIKSQVAECHVESCEKLTLTKCNQCNSVICSKCFVNHQIKC